MVSTMQLSARSRDAVTARARGRGLAEAVTRSFAPHPRPGRRVGLEIELIPDVPTYDHHGSAGRGIAVSVEPGGQLELSLAPRPTFDAAVSAATRAIAAARSRAAEHGVSLQLVGVNPQRDWYDVPLRKATPRYLAMQELFDEIGQDGRRMMRTTAALQINVDLHPGHAGLEQWFVANLVGPTLAVAFGNSPATRSRTAIWRGVDLGRTGYDGRHLDRKDPVGAYTAFAASAATFPIPESADPTYHLSTLFPPVRPRGGYLELRFLDAQPVERLDSVVRTVAALMYDPTARREAHDLLKGDLGGIDSAWAAAADGTPSSVVRDVVDIAAAGAARLATATRTES
jgi:glutamate--cysteine ligase